MNRIQQIGRGDMEALIQVYEKYKVRIYRLALSMLGDTYLAEDVTQETFLRVQERAASYRREISEGAWIAAIARNLSLDCLRRKGREVTGDWERREDEGPSLSEALEARAAEEGKDEHSSLYYLDLIACLAPEEREIVNLRIVTGLSWKEIGKITGIKAEACRKRYVRGLKKLQDKL